MENFTPLKAKKSKKKINKFLIFGNLFLVVLIAVIGIVYYNNILITQEQKAGESGCNGYDSAQVCNANCSPTKNDGNKYECKWNYNTQSCHDSQTICGGGGGGGGGGIIGGIGCIKIDNKCYDCPLKSSGDAWHYTCSYIPSSGYGCPNSIQTGSVTKSYLGKLNSGTQRFCFDRGPNGCGSEQIDYPKGFISRIGPEPCGGGGEIPTLTPTQPIVTNTPTPTKTPTPTRTPTPTQPIFSTCNSLCSSSNPCTNEEPGTNELVCTSVDSSSSQRCRNKSCPTESDCTCSTVTNTPTPTRTPTPTITPTGTLVPTSTPTGTQSPTLTPIPVLCGTKDCDDATNPCRSGYICVQAHDGSNYCTSPDFAEACKENPSYTSCCTAPGSPSATPTEIVLAQSVVTSTPIAPVSGVVTIQSILIYLLPLTIIGLGILL